MSEKPSAFRSSCDWAKPGGGGFALGPFPPARQLSRRSPIPSLSQSASFTPPAQVLGSVPGPLPGCWLLATPGQLSIRFDQPSPSSSELGRELGSQAFGKPSPSESWLLTLEARGSQALFGTSTQTSKELAWPSSS